MEWNNIVISSKKEPELSENALLVLEKRYLARDDGGAVIETPKELFLRVAKFVASAESAYGAAAERVSETADRFYEMMADLSFLPNTPTLMNAGRPLGQLAACFVLPVEDSMEGIFDAVKQMALIHKSGGGTGFSFSRLRPRDDIVKSTAGVSSGPVSFMNIFNAATETVKQGGTRRGANMAILSVDHPDILKFIRAKEDKNALTNFNISVALTDSFMDAVERDEEFPLVNPNSKKSPGSLRAREVFDLIVRKAWESGEPGVIFIDRINAANPLKKIGAIESTNPCVTGDTLVLTSNGPRTVNELTGTAFTAIVNGVGHPTATEGFFKTGRKPVFRLKTGEGHEVRLTADHPVLRAASICRSSILTEWVPARELNGGDRICLHNHRDFPGWEGAYGFPEGYLVGLVVGDGTIKKDKVIISVWPKKQAVNGGPIEDPVMGQAVEFAMTLPHRSDFHGFVEVRGRGEYRMSTVALRHICETLGLAPGRKAITRAIEKCSSDFYRGFLRGLFDSDGSVQGTQSKGVSVRLAQSDEAVLKGVQRMLLRLGIASVIYRNRRDEGETMLPDGKGGLKAYPVRSQHELIISRDNLSVFAEKIGFTDTDKRLRLSRLLSTYTRPFYRNRFVATVEEIIPDGTEDVFDVRVPGINRFDGNGFVLHNCGEQPLLPYESCNLGSINLNRFIREKKGGAAVDFDALKRVTRLAVRFLDNVIDVNRYPLDRIRENTLANRKIGLGVMGFADLLVRLGVPYDSDDAAALAGEVMSAIQEESKRASEDLAEERGAFPNFSRSEYAARGAKPLRNATTTTIAPTGTISIIAGSSSGIEPIYALAYVRNVMDDNVLVEVNPLFEAMARERRFFSEDLMARIAAAGSAAGVDGVPDDARRIFVSAHDISPEWHIRIQAAFQRHVDNAVSKTVNFRNDAAMEEIDQVYRLAYHLGCKGVTVYRDRSRDNQVLDSGTRPEPPKAAAEETTTGGEGLRITPRSRDDITWGTTRKMATGCGSLYVTINEDRQGLFEVFATMGKGGGCAASQIEAVSRLISLALRCGIDREQIIKQLKGVRCPNQAWEKGGRIYSCADAIAKALERHAGIERPENDDPDHDTAKNNAETNGRRSDVVMVGVCPDCGGPLEFESGCAVCRSCGFSRCG
ncbi:MAG: TSCPD domain-containing protein [Spirochaetes bacterium]|nr:TSCPD domain-containing protein [Spirochaetota bacterium]